MKVDITADSINVTAKAKAIMLGPDVEGLATFTELDIEGSKYVHLRLELKGDPQTLSEGKHAVHIHEKGDCGCDGFKCAGGHFDPGPSGNTDPDANHGYHAGDLPSIKINGNGEGILEAITTRVTLSDGPVSVLQPKEGTSLMIHANPDPHTPGKPGFGHSGGPRLACGKIVKL